MENQVMVMTAMWGLLVLVLYVFLLWAGAHLAEWMANKWGPDITLPAGMAISSLVTLFCINMLGWAERLIWVAQ